MFFPNLTWTGSPESSFGSSLVPLSQYSLYFVDVLANFGVLLLQPLVSELLLPRVDYHVNSCSSIIVHESKPYHSLECCGNATVYYERHYFLQVPYTSTAWQSYSPFTLTIWLWIFRTRGFYLESMFSSKAFHVKAVEWHIICNYYLWNTICLEKIGLKCFITIPAVFSFWSKQTSENLEK